PVAESAVPPPSPPPRSTAGEEKAASAQALPKGAPATPPPGPVQTDKSTAHKKTEAVKTTAEPKGAKTPTQPEGPHSTVALPAKPQDAEGSAASPPFTTLPSTVSGAPPARLPSLPKEWGTEAAQRPSLLEQASRAFHQGDMERAERLFRALLQADPRSHHGMIGLASVSMRRGDTETARFWYQRVLREDPNNSVAIAANLGLSGGGHGSDEESRLKHLLQSHPNARHLHFALGTLYATQKRWALAYSAFANANTLSQEKNPEILLNLAASLDHLHRPAEALSYYQKALTVVEERPELQVNFDVESVRHRVEVLWQKQSGGQEGTRP
ncbi:MAG: tetratricopeptide repeat protein, partial [Magnetococcales bacterium]|nr:tetratricopeptide repeat protein [Magnetococcales bacterium]